MAKSRLVGMATKAQQYKKLRWIDGVNKEQFGELSALKKAYHSGELKSETGITPSMASLHKLAGKELSLTVKKSAFIDWFRQP